MIDQFLQKVADFVFPKRVTPNDVTTLRVVMVIPLLYCILKEQYVWALVFFLLAGVLDLLDGPLARRRNLITEQGKLWDPVADKILVMVPILVLLLSDHISSLNGYLIGCIITTESILIAIAAIKYLWPQIMPQRKLGANLFGKGKMVCQSIGVIILIFSQFQDGLNDVAHIIFIIAVGLAVMSIMGHLFGFGNQRHNKNNNQ